MRNLNHTNSHHETIHQTQLPPQRSPPSTPQPSLTNLLTRTTPTSINTPHPERRPIPATDPRIRLITLEGLPIPLVGAVVAHPAVRATRAVAVGDAGAGKGKEGRRGGGEEGDGDVRWCLLKRFCALEFGWWSLLLIDEEDGGNPFNTGSLPPFIGLCFLFPTNW